MIQALVQIGPSAIWIEADRQHFHLCWGDPKHTAVGESMGLFTSIEWPKIGALLGAAAAGVVGHLQIVTKRRQWQRLPKLNPAAAK